MNVIQVTTGGVPYEPELFSSRAVAEVRWRELVDAGYRYDRDGNPVIALKAFRLSYLTADPEGYSEARWYEHIEVDANAQPTEAH